MPKDRQPLVLPPDLNVAAVRGGVRVPHGFRMGAHTHDLGMLVYSATGVLITVTAHGTLVAPANRLTWTPPGFEHAHRFYGQADVRVVNLPIALSTELSPEPAVYAVSPLLREVIFTLVDRPETRPGAHLRLQAVLVDDLVRAPDRALHFPEASDDRLHTVTEFLRADPAQPATLAELGRAAGASERTLSRLFRDELGMSFQRWRTILRIHHALVYLGDGLSVTATATRCGWSNPTSFIDAFTELIGQTPGRYQSDLRGHNDDDATASTTHTTTPPLSNWTDWLHLLETR